MENKKLQTGGETTNTDSSNDFFNYVDNIFKTQILPKKDIEPALPKIEDLDIDLDLIKKVDEPDLGWKSAKEKFLTDTFEVGTSDEELNRIKNFDFSLRDGDNRYQRRYDNMNLGSNLLRTVGNYAATGMEIATGMAGGLWEGGEELVDEVSEQTGLDIYNNKEFGKNWLLSASDWLRESKPEIYDRDGVEQGEGNFWEQLKDIKSLDLGDIYKAGSVIPSVFGSMAVAIPLTAVIMPSSIAAGAAVGGVPGAVVGGFMGKTAVAAALAYAEGMMDAKDVYKEKYDEIFEKTMDVNYAENVAKTAANKNLLYNTALNTPLNLIEVGFLTKYLKKPAFKSFDTFNPDKLHGRYKPTLLAGETTEDYIARMARNEIRDSSGNVIGYKSNLNRSFTEFLKDIPDDIGYNIRNKKEFIGRHYDDILSPLSEGLEEYNNFWSREKGMENVDTKLSIAGMLSDGTSYLPEFAQNMKEGEGVFDILSGMLGAVVTNPIMTNVHIKRDKIYDPISNTYKFKYDRSDLNPFKETDFFQFGKKEADKKDMKSYIERSIDNIRTTKKLFSDFNNSPDIETKSHLLDQMMIQPITEAISSNTLNTKIATYQEGLNMLQEKRNEPLENKLDFLSTTDKTNVQNLMLKLSTASEQVEIDTINGQLDNYNKTANKHIELQSKTIKENIDYLNQLNTAYVSLYSQKQTENDYGYLNELFKAQFSYDQELKFRTKLERDLESRITELTSSAPNKNEALMSLENDTEFNQAQDNLLASEIRAMQFGARLNMLRRGEFLEDTHNILEQDLIDKIETYKIDSSEILAYKKYVRLKSLPERFQESIKGELKRMEENELKSFFEFKNNYNQLIELQNKKAKEDNESAIYKYIKRSQKVADLHHKLAKNKVEFDNFYKLIDSTSAYFKYFTEFGDFGYDELISNLTSQLAMKDWYSNYLTFYNAVIQDIELFEVNNPTLSSDYKGRIIHLKKQIKTNHLRITQFYIIQSTKFKKRNIIDDILGYLNSNQKPVSGKLPWNYEDLLNNIKSEFGITVDEDGTYQTNRVNYVIQYEDKFHIAKNESKKIEYDFNTNSFISVEYINEFKRNDPKLIVISKRTTPLNYNDDYIDLSSGTLLKDFLKENGLTLTLVNEYNIDVVNGVNLNIFTEDKDNKKRQLIFIKEALASKDKSPDISKLSNDSKDIYNKIKKALEDTTNSLVLSDSGNTPIDRNNLDNIIEIMQNDLTLEIINERFTEEEIKDMMEGKDEAIENIIKVLTDGELPDTKNLREIYNKYFKEIDGIKSAFIDDDEYDIKESYNKWGGILITHIFKSIESMDLKSKIDIAHRLRKSIGSENADSVKDLHYQLFFYYIGDEKILSEIKDELIHNINDMKKSVFEIEPELIDGDYDKIINGNEKEVEGLIESYQGFYKAIKFINKLRQIEGELFSDFDRIIDEENQIFNDKDKTLLKARFNKDKLNEYYDNWINSLGVRVTPKDVVEDVKDLTVTNTPIPPTTNTPVPPTTSNQSEIEAKKAAIERRRQEALKKFGTSKNKTSNNSIKVLGINEYVSRELMELAYSNDSGNNPEIGGFGQTLDRIIQRGGYSKEELMLFLKPEIDKINAKYDAELKALEQQPTTSNQSEIEAKKAGIERRRQGLNGVEEIIFSNPNFRLEGFEIDGNYWNVVTSTDRAKVLVNVNGVIVPFYLTTGQAGKGLIPGWYPFFGIGKDGWLNKTDKSDMETYYERYWGKETANIVKSISEELNSFYGTDPTNFKNDGDPNATSRPLTTLADKVEDYINSKLNYTPAINNGDARKTLRSNVEQLGKEINAKYDAELAELGKIQPKETIPNVEAKIADIESKTKEELFPVDSLYKGKESGDILKVIGYTKDGVRFQIQTSGKVKPTKNLIFSELKRLISEGKLFPYSDIEAKKAEILKRKEERLNNVKPAYHHTKVDAKDFDFNNFQRGKNQISQFGDGLNASTNTTSFLVKRYGKAIQGEVNDLDFVVIDTNKSQKELYQELISKGFKFNSPQVGKSTSKGGKYINNNPEEEYDGDEAANLNPAILTMFNDFQQSNSEVKGVKIINHIIGGENVAPFYVIYDAKSFYGQGSLTKKIEDEANEELRLLEIENSSQSELDAKIADIERRRQEELLKIGNEAIPKEVQEFINIDNSGKKVKVTYVPVAGKSLAVVLIDWFSRNIPNVKTKNYKFIGDSIQVDITLEGLGNWQTWELPIVSTIGGSGSFIEVNLSEWGKTLINAKYDAELKALGQQQENLQKEENKRQEIKRQEEELNRLIAIEEAQKEQEKAAEAEAEKQQKLRDLHNDVSFSLGFFETADKQKNLIKLMRANQTKIDPNSNFKFEINSVIYDSIEELFKHDSSYINLNSTIKVLDEKDNVIKEIPLTVNNKLIKDILLDDDILIRDMMSKRREEVLKLLTNTSSTDPIKYNFNKLVKLIEFEYLFGIFEIDDIEHYDTYNKVVLFLNKLKGSGDIIVDTSTNVPSFKFNIGTKNEKNYDGLKIPEDVEIFQLVQLKDTELKKAFYENYKYEDKYYYDEKTNKLTFKNKNDFNKVRAGYYTEDDGTNSEFPYAKTRKIFPSVIDWALYKKNPLLYLKHKKRGINLDGETNLINSTSLKFNTDAYKNKLIKSFQLLKSTPKIFEFTYKDSTETEIRIRIEKSENGEFTVITDLDEKSGLSRHESLKVDGTYTFYLDDNKENMLFQIIENKVETSSFKYENAKKVLDDIIKEMTDENNIAEWEDEKFSRFYSDIDVTMYNKFLYVIRELRANLFLLGNPIIKDIIYYFTDFGDSIYLDSNRNAVKFEFRNELPYDIPINNLIDFTRSLFEDFNLDDFNVVVKGLSEVKLESLVDIKTLTFYKNQVKHITESESNYLLWLKQYFYYLHKYNPNKQREIQVGNKLYKLNGLVRLKDSKDLVHITDITNEDGIPKFNNIVFDSDLHEAEVFSENDNELINGDKIYIFKNNEWRIKSEGDIEEIDEDLRNLLEDFRNKEIININNKDKNADLLVNNSIRFVNIINNRLRNDNEKLLINENLIENKINKDTLLKIIQNNKQDILNFVFRKSDSKFDDSDVHIQVPDEDLSNKIKKDALSEENYDALAYVLTNEGKLIPQNGGIVENDFRSFEVDANKINTDIKAFFNGEILNFKENGKAIIEVRSVKVTTKFEEISIGDNNSLELLVTSNAVELFILINHYLDPKGELDLLNNLNEKDVNELKTKANIYARIRILLDGVGIDQPIEKYIKDNFEDIHTLYKNVIQVVQIETDEVETDKSVHLGYLHDLTHYFKSNDIEKAYSMIVNYYNKVLSKFIKNDFQLKFKVRIENEGYLIASDKEDSFLVNYPKITKVYRFKGHGKDVKLHEFDVKNGKFKQVLLDVFEEKELKAIITEFLLIEDSNTDKVPDKEDLILMIETYLKNKDTINTAFFTILDNQFSFNKRILKLNNNKWDSIKENDKNLYQHYFDLFLGTLQKGTTNENIKSIIDNLFILYKDYGVSESEYANDKSKKKIELLLSKIDNESYYKNIVLPIYVVKNGNDFVFKLIGKIGNMIHVLELTRNGGHITYKMLKYDIGTEKLAENIQDDLAKTTPLDKDGYIAWLELMFPYIPIDIDMASFNKVDFGGSEIERFKLSYFTNTKSIEGNNFTNPLVKLDLREVEPYKTKSDKVDSAKIIDENITTKNLNLRTSLTELSSNTKGFSKGDVDSVILKILNVTSTQNEEAFNLILNEFKPLQVILQDFEDKIKITSISQTTFINNFKEFFKKNRGNINQFLIEKSNGDDSNNIESCI